MACDACNKHSAKIYASQTHEVAILIQLLYMNNSLANVSHRDLQLYTKMCRVIATRHDSFPYGGALFIIV